MEGYEYKHWQKRLIEEIKKQPDDRKIFWFTDKLGGAGKTTFCKHLVMRHNALYLSGKKQDILYCLKTYIEQGGEPEIVLFDFTRSLENFVSYSAIESIKNGICFSGKYESSQLLFNPPHIFCFANFEPEYNKMSKDRWINLDPILCELYNL